MHLGRAVVDSERPHLSQELSQRQIVGNTEAAAHLDRPIDDADHRLGHEDLRHRRFMASGCARIQCVGRTIDQAASSFEFDLRIGKLLLDHPVFGERGSEYRPSLDLVGRYVLRTLGKSEPSHAMREPSRSQSDLRMSEAMADLAEHCVRRHRAVSEFELTMPACER